MRSINLAELSLAYYFPSMNSVLFFLHEVFFRLKKSVQQCRMAENHRRSVSPVVVMAKHEQFQA